MNAKMAKLLFRYAAREGKRPAEVKRWYYALSSKQKMKLLKRLRKEHEVSGYKKVTYKDGCFQIKREES